MERTFTAAEIEAAFDRLLAFMTPRSDAATTWAIAAAKDDVLDILHNDWHADESQCIEAEAEVGAAELYATVGAW